MLSRSALEARPGVPRAGHASRASAIPAIRPTAASPASACSRVLTAADEGCMLGCSTSSIRASVGIARHAHRSVGCSAAAPASADPSTSGSPLQPSSLKKGTLILAQLPEDQFPGSGGEQYLEVLSDWDASQGRCRVAWRGRLLELSLPQQGTGDALAVSHQGTYPAAGSPLLKHFPGWGAALARLAPHLGAPAWQAQGLPLSRLSLAGSLQELEERVKANAGPWCNGTAPGEAPPTGLAYQLMGAGELLALMEGQRGLVMVQLYAGWHDDLGAAPQPVNNPFVVTLLARAVAEGSGLVVTMSSISGGVGLTALVSAKKDPFKAWAGHMASFGAQAAVVAESPYYKLLIGRMLGYPEAHVAAHIQKVHGVGHPDLKVVAAVDEQMRKLSAKKPILPWNASSRGKKKQA